MTPRKQSVIFISAELHFRLVLNLRIVIHSEEPAKIKPIHVLQPSKTFCSEFYLT